MCVFFFFFQAEDGIRDLYVTGVQTCALPIFRAGGGAGPLSSWERARRERARASSGTDPLLRSIPSQCSSRRGALCSSRSEERRVGKECRSRVAAEHEKKKSRMSLMWK